MEWAELGKPSAYHWHALQHVPFQTQGAVAVVVAERRCVRGELGTAP